MPAHATVQEGAPMQRDIFTPEHDAFRDMVRTFIAREITPHHEQWERDGMVSRDVWLAAGRAGLLGIDIDEKYGGGGNPDYRYYLILDEELAVAGANGPGFAVHNDINGHYFAHLSTPEQRERWLPGYCSGELITAIAMTEPGAGSDLAGIKTTARRDGDHYLLDGQKTFISNAILCDLAIVATKTDPKADHRGITLFVVEAGTPGFVKGKKLEKMGMASQDTGELFFEGCRVPAANRLGEEGSGWKMMMTNLQQERLVVAIHAQAAAEQVLRDTIAYCQERKAFGQLIGHFQNTQFKLADCAAEVEVGRAFLDKLLAEHVKGKPLVKECSMAKLWQ